ncbi:MAG: response regulator, partial [Rhodocyclaceae bacterium]|nr:response regulator [Rhodocyclaceae bacterium]
YNASVYRDHNGQVLGVFAAARDVTEQKRLEQILTARNLELEQAKNLAEGANRAKSAFLANMSHELRTPLNAITGMTYLVRGAGVAPRQAEHLKKIETAVEHLLEIINSVLDLSKIEAGKFSFEETAVNVGAILANIASMLSERAEAKKVALQFEVGPMPHHLLGDPTRLQQALLNYVGNAIKFTESGSVTMRAELKEDTLDSALVRFEVQDTGVGISPPAIERLFSAFEQADNSTTRKYGGTGLGLAITKKLAQLMGGEVGVTSHVGRGSTFWFTARLKKNSEGARARPAEASVQDAKARLREKFSGKRVLIAEDDPVNEEVARILLEEVGLAVDSAADGGEAADRAGSRHYDLILMDMQMPRLSGLDATRLIRTTPKGKSVPILAMTANAFSDDRARCLDAGMNDFIAKPYDPDLLFETLLRWLEYDAPAHGPMSAEVKFEPQNVTIGARAADLE